MMIIEILRQGLLIKFWAASVLIDKLGFCVLSSVKAFIIVPLCHNKGLGSTIEGTVKCLNASPWEVL